MMNKITKNQMLNKITKVGDKFIEKFFLTEILPRMH